MVYVLLGFVQLEANYGREYVLGVFASLDAAEAKRERVSRNYESLRIAEYDGNTGEEIRSTVS
jgi:hypothetical protein